MESYMDLEVPDTPDRLASAKVCSSSTRQSMGDLDSHAHHPKRGRKGSSTISITPDETDLLFEQARLAMSVSENPKGNGSSKLTSTVQKLGQKELSTENIERDFSDSSPISTTYPKECGSFRTKEGKEPIFEKNKLLEHHASSDLLGVLGSSLPGVVAVRPRSRLKITSSKQDKAVLQVKTHAHAMCSGKGKGTLLSNVVQPKSEQTSPITSPSGAASKSKGQRRLVRNGCISPFNIERNNNVIPHSKGLVSEKGQIALPNGINSKKLPPEKGNVCSIDLLSNSDIELPCVSSTDPPNSIQIMDHCQNGMTCSRETAFSSFSGSNNQNSLKGSDLLDESNRSKQRRLIQNECISQNNIALSRTIRKQKENEIETMIPNESNISACKLQNADCNFEERNDNNRKGKAVIDDFAASGRQNGKLVLKSGRPNTSSRTNATASGDTNDNASASEDLGWRRIHKTEEASYPQFDQSNIVGLGNNIHFNNRTEISDFHVSNSSVEQPISLMNQESPIKETIKGKRKHKEMNCSHGENSSLNFDNSDICLGASWQPSISSLRSSRTRNLNGGAVTLGRIIEIGDLNSPGVTLEHPLEKNYAGSESSDAMARQVESDELLARQLQEELYNQSPASGNFEEIDAVIARSLQHEENAQGASSTSRRTQPTRIDAVIAQSLQHEENAQGASSTSRRTQPTRRERLAARLHPGQPSRSSLSSSSNHGRYRQPTGVAQLMRNVNFEGMDVSARLNFLEELEYAFNNGRGRAVSHVLQVQRDFNEDDYEILLALDDNNHHHSGASQNRINNLPHSVVQTDNIEEPCAVCLEKLSLGDTIRHLPCLHKFHKDCIDEWLRRKTSCPVCKADIT